MILGIDTKHATNAIEALQQAARDKTLTRRMYVHARDRIRKRSGSWTWSLGILAIVALYNSIGLIIGEHKGLSSLSDSSPFFLVLYMGKEVVLLIMLLAMVVRVNDSADAITTILNRQPWGEPGTKEESTRQDLLMLALCSSVTPEAALSMWKRIVAPKSEGITFRICGLKPTGAWAAASVISLALSVLSGVVHIILF